MRILAVSNLYPPDVIGGYEMACAQVVASLGNGGHEVTVLTSAPRRPVAAGDGVHRGLQLSDVYDPDLANPRSATTRTRLNVSALWVDAANVHRLLDELADVRPDVVYLWNLVGIGGLSLVLALQKMGIPWVWHLGDHVPALLSGLRGPVNPRIARLFARPLDGTYITCSTHVSEEIRADGVQLTGRVELIPNWVTTAPRRAIASPPLNAGPLRILMASVVTRYKGVDIMMQAAALLRERGIRDFTVDVYGRVLDQTLHGLVEELELGDCFHLRGELPQDELFEVYREYDLFAFPVWGREPFGVAALEAASSGCPVLMTETCGIAEWLVDGVHCLKVERTPEAFAAGIERAMHDRLDLAAIATRAQRAVQRDFHLKAILPRVEKVLAEAAATRRPAAADRDRVYRIALLAERLASVVIDEAPES